MDLQELKAHGYDCLANIEFWKNELKVTNDLIIKYFKNNKNKKEANEK